MHHINKYVNKGNKANKADNGIGSICKLNNILHCSALLTMYRSFSRLHLDYGDVIYDQPEKESFRSNIETVQ